MTSRPYIEITRIRRFSAEIHHYIGGFYNEIHKIQNLSPPFENKRAVTWALHQEPFDLLFNMADLILGRAHLSPIILDDSTVYYEEVCGDSRMESRMR